MRKREKRDGRIERDIGTEKEITEIVRDRRIERDRYRERDRLIESEIQRQSVKTDLFNLPYPPSPTFPN